MRIPWGTVALDPDAVDQGFDVLRIIAPSVADDDAFRALVGPRGEPGTVAELKHADILEVIAAADCARRSRASRRRR